VVPEGGEGGRGQVGALDLRTHDLVARPARGIEAHVVGQVDGVEEGHELVAAVGAHRPDEQAQVDLGR